MHRIAVLVLVSLGIAAAAGAQSNPVEARRAIMKQLGDHVYDALAKMSRGETPYDQARVNTAFEDLAASAAKLPDLFPESAKTGGGPSRYAASPKIWEKKPDFDARLAAFVKAVSEARPQANSLDGLRAVYPGLRQNCTDCHQVYRIRTN